MLNTLALAGALALAPAALVQDTAPPPVAADTNAAAEAPPERARPPADSAALATAYVDDDARELLRRARERRRVVDRSIEAYEVNAAERISLGLRALRRDRLFYQRETASRIAWQREGPVTIEVLGAREVLPAVLPAPQVPAGLTRYMPHLAFDPGEQYLLVGAGPDGDIPHPLAPGAEVDYRYRSGDTTDVRLPDGRSVRLLELEVIPRRKSWELVRGSFWLDAATHAVVQATFRMADHFDLERDDDDDDIDKLPGLLKPIRARVEYITMEYALWDFTWWLPRVIAFRGVASLGKAVSLPLLYERTYTGYDVVGDTAAAAASPMHPGDSLPPARRARCPVSFVVTAGSGGSGAPRPDSAAAQPPRPQDRVRADTVEAGPRRGLTDEQRRECERFQVVLPEDSASLLTSELLPASPYIYGEALLSESELRSIRAQLEQLAPLPWGIGRPQLRWGLGGPGLLRYNRVEGLSLGVSAEVDFGPLSATATARLGAADLEPNGELALSHDGIRARAQLAGYRRLVGMDPAARPFSIASSLSALALGRDEADYYRTLGAELTGEPPLSRPRWYDWRLYAQRESAAEKETDFSVAHLLDRGDFRENLAADRATQYGAELRLRGEWGRDPRGLRIGTELGLEGATGSFRYGRPSLLVQTGFPLPGRFVGALEGAGGTTVGDPAVQHLWRVGGPGSLRGYASGARSGESFLRARGEVATQLPLARLVLFSDAGWAGDFADVRTDPWLVSAGVGASVLGGLIRLDLARALRRPTGWRLVAYVDAWL